MSSVCRMSTCWSLYLMTAQAGCLQDYGKMRRWVYVMKLQTHTLQQTHLEQTALHCSICWNYWNLLYQTEDTPISRHCIIDISYPATDSFFFVKLAINIRLVNDDIIFLFTFYKHCRKQISAVILKPNIEVISSSTRYLYENFLSYDRAYIYAYTQTYDFSFVRKFCE